MTNNLSPATSLPRDADRATLIGRIWQPGIGPTLVAVHEGGLHDLSHLAPTLSDLLEAEAPPADAVRDAVQSGKAPRIAHLAEVLANSFESQADETNARDFGQPWLLAPCDLQAIKASGVTFVASLLERVIEEQSRGDASKADSIRSALSGVLGDNLAGIVPGSPEAAKVKALRVPSGITRSPRSYWRSTAAARRWAPRWATTSTCATSKAAARCCWARRKTTTRHAPSGRSFACSMRTSASTMCAASRSG